MSEGVASPCIEVCRIEPASGLCEGCLRTLPEIAHWPDADETEKRAILRRIEMRRAGLPALPDRRG
jgi:predicted Fe-S protein YdhL (DUF1289 family)